ncbi:Ionotropic receptor 93a [Nymphon striatum]|nr:Ionotropic receptor 93a [Nymphon striatum]
MAHFYLSEVGYTLLWHCSWFFGASNSNWLDFMQNITQGSSKVRLKNPGQLQLFNCVCCLYCLSKICLHLIAERRAREYTTHPTPPIKNHGYGHDVDCLFFFFRIKNMEFDLLDRFWKPGKKCKKWQNRPGKKWKTIRKLLRAICSSHFLIWQQCIVPLYLIYSHNMLLILKGQNKFNWVCCKRPIDTFKAHSESSYIFLLRKAGYGHYTVFVVKVKEPCLCFYSKALLFETRHWSMALNMLLEERLRKVNFTDPFDNNLLSFMTYRPDSSYRDFLFLEPFTFTSWLGIAAMVSLMGPILFGIHRFSYYYKINDQTSKSKGLCSFGNCSWYIFGAMVNQGGIHLPAADSGRLAVAFWWIFQIITVTTYSGNLVAFLTFPKQENPFDNIANLRSSNLKWASIKQSSLEFLGAQAKEGILKEIYTTSKFYEKNDESKVISNVRNQKEVFFYDRVKLLIEQANDYDRNGHCGLEPSTTILSENPIGLAVPAHSPSLKLLNTEIRKMLQGGLVDKWKRKYWPGENACTMKKTAEIDSNRTVTLSQIYGSYYVLAIGFGAGIIMLLAEYVSKKYRNKTNRVQSIDIRQELAIENMTRVHF